MNPVKPTGFHVLIKSQELNKSVDEEKFSELAKAGFQESTSDEHARRQAGQIWGEIVDMGPVAFTGADWGDEEVKVGDKVLFSRYGGQTFSQPGTVESNSYALWRVCPDSDVIAVVNDDSIQHIEE